jgi:hypothetical protein
MNEEQRVANTIAEVTREGVKHVEIKVTQNLYSRPLKDCFLAGFLATLGGVSALVLCRFFGVFDAAVAYTVP